MLVQSRERVAPDAARTSRPARDAAVAAGAVGHGPRRPSMAVLAFLTTLVVAVVLLLAQQPAAAQVEPPSGGAPEAPVVPIPQVGTPALDAGDASSDEAGDAEDGRAGISVDVGSATEKPSQSVLIILGLTVLGMAPSLLIMLTSFTRMVIVLSLTRNALGLQSIPPNQVVVGLALFLSLFVMGPTLSEVNEVGLQPLLKGDKTQAEAFEDGSVPLKDFMLRNTREGELRMMISASGQDRPETKDDVSLATLIPAFILSELKTAFIIGFVIFVPFLVIDLVVSSVLMAMGMMMLPPVFVSLPFKLLLFVMVDGWTLIAESLLRSFN